MNLRPGARAFARALFLSVALHGALLFLMPEPLPGSVGAPTLFPRMEATLVRRDDRDAFLQQEEKADGMSALLAHAEKDERNIGSAPPLDAPSPSPSAPQGRPVGAEVVPAELLTVRPRPLRLPLDAERFRPLPAEGRAVLEITVRRNGKVSNLRVAYNDLPGPILAHVMRVFASASYEPGELAGVAVDALLRVEVSVTEGGAAVVSGEGTSRFQGSAHQ